MKNNTTQRRSWRVWILGPLGLLALAIAGRWLFPRLTGQVHPDSRAILSVTGTAPSAPSAPWSMAADRARLLIRARLAEQNLPGLSVAVGVGGTLVWSEGFGWADLATRTPVTPDTRFRLGTASTMLTSAGVGALLEKGRLKLDDEIQSYVPQLPKKQWPVTLRQLMAQVAGLGPDSGTDGGTGSDDEGPLFRQRCGRPLEALPHFANRPLLFQPGTQYRPSNDGWILVSAAVEAAAGQPFLTYMQEQVFQPLGMNHTGAESSTEENPEGIGEPGEDAPPITFLRQMVLEPLGIAGPPARAETAPATLYVRGFGRRLNPLAARNLSCYAGSLAFNSTPADLVRFGLSMNCGKLLQPATVQALQASQRLASGKETGYGLGWNASARSGQDGELRGRRVASLTMFRDTGIVVAVTTNADADTAALALKVAEAFAANHR